ncbi:class I SAM-dependent methyltransferase [Thiothrix sp.]|jgi:ubiquinone/menaquinone biosynthesis C-methylase UbiE|uniref:class I SAM-dependent methyltransferase n=1 Tax=Thiothrix sp. TaxID=1032 RepID=UPI00257CF1F4|nr:class I SAM-dependent methyltransferase [Thiothrix sp.]
MNNNLHKATVEGFGDEWERFDQSELPHEEQQRIFDAYFSIFPWDILPKDAEGFDLGCGSGRWAKLAAPHIGKLHCIDPSSALEVAKRNLAENYNCEFHLASVDAIPLNNATMDFGYSLGVLHHVPDTQAAISACVEKLKIGAPLLLYLYYAFDNRPLWFRLLWKTSDLLRQLISRLPYGARYFTSQILAATIYFPLAKTALFFEKMGLSVDHLPLSTYRNYSFYTMRTDALDRFGTRLEQRFTQKQIELMMEKAGLENIQFSSAVPYWCAVGYRKKPEDSKT